MVLVCCDTGQVERGKEETADFLKMMNGRIFTEAKNKEGRE